MKQTIILTGVGGMIGANLAQWILDNTEHDVIGIDNFSGGEIRNTPEISNRFIIFHEDICNAKQIEEIFRITSPTICFQLAAYAAEGRSNYIRGFIHSNNTVGTANVINACINHNCKLVFTSSVAVYSGNPPYNEETEPRPIDEYGLSKLTSEQSIKIAGEQSGLDWCIVRPRNVYGEKQSLFDECRNVIGIWMYQILNKLPMTIFGDGGNKRCFTYIGDIVEPLYKAAFCSKEIINLGSPIPYSIKDANKILQEITGYENVEYLEPRHEVEEAICDTLKSQILLNYNHTTYLKEGLIKMWEWAKKQPMQERKTPPSLEINTKTHSSIK